MTRRPPTPKQRPFPFADLERLVQVPLGENGQLRKPLAAVADAVGIRYDSARQLMHRNDWTLTFDQADRWATAVGFHPAEVWPQWFDIVAAEQRAERNRKSAAFERRKYRRNAAHRAYKLRKSAEYRAQYGPALNARRVARRASDPEFRERRRAGDRSYYARNRERFLAAQRARRAQQRESAA